MRAPEFWRTGGVLGVLLAPAGWVYGICGRIQRGLVTSRKVEIPVICIGNAVAGGAGKTPVALAVAALLRQRGHQVHFLSRGYGGREQGPILVDPVLHTAADVGDEPLLLAAEAPTWVAKNRAAGAAAAQEGAAEIVVMDDGMQNPSLQKDLTLLVVDGGYGFGNGRPIPAGPLRTFLGEAMDAADGFVISGVDRLGLGRRLEKTGKPVFAARPVPTPDAEALSGRKVAAIAGIARPEKFLATLAELGCEVVSFQAYPDHHAFREDEIAALVEAAAEADAMPVTTAKDWVRLPESAKSLIGQVDIMLEWNDLDALQSFLAEHLRSPGAS